jgi:predicted DNA-binding protein (MmcQ/YjbR family)
MTIEDIQLICKKLNGVTEDIKWGDHLCFNIGGKMFLVTAPDQVPPSASIKVSDDDFDVLTSKEGVIPAPYMAKHKWVFLEDINTFTRKQWEQYIPQAYRLIVAKLPAKTQRSLGLLVEGLLVDEKKPNKTAKTKSIKKPAAKRKQL